MSQNERMFWHYVIAIAAALGVLGVIVEFIRYGTIGVPCCQ